MFEMEMKQLKSLKAARLEIAKVFPDGCVPFSISQAFIFFKEG